MKVEIVKIYLAARRPDRFQEPVRSAGVVFPNKRRPLRMMIMNGLRWRGVWLGCVIAAAMLAGSFPAEAQKVLRVVGNRAPPYRIIEGTKFFFKCVGVCDTMRKHENA